MIDDFQLVARFQSWSGWNLNSIFFPSVSGGYYYRPVVDTSFLLDKHLFGLQPGIMHVENVFLHIANAFLVFLLTRQLIAFSRCPDSKLPFVAALLFGLHPINSETVNWISGRYDLLAGTLIFSSSFFLLKFRENGSKKNIALSLLAFLGAVLAKETSIAFLPGALLLLHTNNKQTANPGHSGMQSWQLKAVSIGVISVVCIYFLFRSAALLTHTSRIGLTIISFNGDWLHSFLLVLQAFGFYMKKLVFPYPLNFAIMEVDPLYTILAVPLAAICMYVALQRTLVSAFFLAGLLLLFPSFILIFGQIAWTPYAERYLYLPSGFIVIATMAWVAQTKIEQSSLAKIGFPLLLGIMLAMTFTRSVIWQNNFSMVKDTVEKSPLARDMRVLYASMLAENGDYDEALMQLDKSGAVPVMNGYNERVDMIRAFIDAKMGRFEDAIERYSMVLQKTNKQRIVVLENLINLLEMKKQASYNKNVQNQLDIKIFLYKRQLYALNHDPCLLYNIGKDAESTGEDEKALSIFKRVRDSLPPEHPYKQIAMKRISRLTKD